eukprot:1488611-Pleurochrysis_carterae.AAC.1
MPVAHYLRTSTLKPRALRVSQALGAPRNIALEAHLANRFLRSSRERAKSHEMPSCSPPANATSQGT